jgi:type II secretory pathway pseudopilin PulG
LTVLDTRPHPAQSPSPPAEDLQLSVPKPPARGISGLGVVVLLIGLAVTAVLSALCYVVNQRNETRLLNLQTKQAATAVQILAAVLEAPLTSGAEVAEAANGDPARFRAYMSRWILNPKQKLFASASLWRLTQTSAQRLTTIGTPPPGTEAARAAFALSSRSSPSLLISGHLSGPRPSIWYAATAGRPSPRFAISAVALVHPDRTAPVQPDSPFAELHYAIYLGRSTRPAQLIQSDVAGHSLRGHTAKVTIAFGDTSLTIVATAAQRLGGTLLAWLWWLVALFGAGASVAAALTAEWLVRRRATSDALRGQVEELLAEQRDIAALLQRALLPDKLPQPAGAEVAARYVPGTDGTEVGGDWYDVLPQGDGRFVFVIGDVSGRGLGAATVMASLRFAIRGFVSEGHDPEAVLMAASRLLDLRTDRHFATVLCGRADLRSGHLTFASAGHLLPVVITETGTTVLSGPVGPPLGVAPAADYPASTVSLPPAGTLLAFTDGLVERRGEDLDGGVARLLGAIGSADARSLNDELDALIAALIPDHAADDTAVVGMRWT